MVGIVVAIGAAKLEPSFGVSGGKWPAAAGPVPSGQPSRECSAGGSPRRAAPSLRAGPGRAGLPRCH